MPAPIMAASAASKPVIGSVREDLAPALAAAVLELEGLALGVLDAGLDVGDEEDSVVVGVPLELPAVGAGVCGVLVVCECDPPDPWWLH